MDLESQISKYLESHANVNARQIAKALFAEKSKINSILYAQKNKLFILHETTPPTWSLKMTNEKTVNFSTKKFNVLKTSTPIHIDFQGGDWALSIQISDSSRNDPVVSLERTGPNSALAKVSSSVISEKTSNSESFPDVVLALSASALAWEIAVQSDAMLEEKFNFQDAIKDIYLSLGAHEIRTRGEN